MRRDFGICQRLKLPHIKKDTTAHAQGAGVVRLFFGCQCSGDRSRGKPFSYLALIVSDTADIVNDYFAIKKYTKSHFLSGYSHKCIIIIHLYVICV